MPVFKNSSGRFLTKSMFYEMTLEDKSSVVYTLKDRDHQGFPSLYRLYMECGDVTEYEFATQHLDCWSHWVELQECSWLKPYIRRWRQELQLKLKARALRQLIKDADSDGSKTKFSSNKFLIEGGWIEKAEKGRPSKDQIKQEAKNIALDQDVMADAFSRLGLTQSQ